MILDSGVCTIYRKIDVSGQGEKPRYELELLALGWYGELEFETNPARPTQSREQIQTDARIRVLQNRSVKAGCEVILTDEGGAVTGETVVYTVTRAFHGTDEESGELITDLTLKEAGKWN